MDRAELTAHHRVRKATVGTVAAAGALLAFTAFSPTAGAQDRTCRARSAASRSAAT